MNELKSIPMDSSKEKKYTFSKRIRKGDITKELQVEQVENGFIITISEDGYKTNAKGERNYYDTRKKYISEINPLEDKKEKKESDTEESNEGKTLIDVINSINTF